MQLTSLPCRTPLDQSKHRTSPSWAVVGGLPGSVTWRLRLFISSLLPAKKLSRAFAGCWQAVVLRFQMKMFESIDSTTTRSGPDLWAEICSCLPHPDQEDSASNAFSDSFMDSYPAGTGQREAPHFAAQPAVKPWAPLQDSEVYLASLEKKLRRIKGLNQEVTSKDMLRTLAQAKKECWDRFLQEKLASEFFVDGLDSDESTLEHFKRWLQPDKVAISTEEVQYLIPPESQVEKPAPGDEPTAAEQ